MQLGPTEGRLHGLAAQLCGRMLSRAEGHAGLQRERGQRRRDLPLGGDLLRRRVPREADEQAARDDDGRPVGLHLCHPVSLHEVLDAEAWRRGQAGAGRREQQGCLDIGADREAHLQARVAPQVPRLEQLAPRLELRRDAARRVHGVDRLLLLRAEGAVAQADAPRARLHEDLAPEHGARVRRRLHVHQEHARIVRLAHAQILRRDLRLRGHVVAVDAHLHAVLIRQREHGPRVAARLHLACHRM
mmetsp:Transcript_52560/g.126088  ORF Transcript_52560/g.126088 Transcript_52560/m.126088 type:complete len:245 (-) Transcript_52560:85-819(-)